MNLEELRSVRRTERQRDSLQHLRDSFYEDVAAYIEERKAERRRAAEAAEDPFGDPDVGRLTDEIETAEDVVEAIYERRVGKVVKLASFAAADMGADTDGLTAEERALFEDLVGRIKRNRRTVLEVLAGEGGAGDGTGSVPDASPSTDAADANSAPADPAASDAAHTAPSTDPAAADSAAADPADENAPPAPDDVLTEAMGGSDDAGSKPRGEGVGSESDAEGVNSESDAERVDSGSADAEVGADADSGSAASAPEVPPDAPPEATDRETTVVDGRGGRDGGEGRNGDRAESGRSADGSTDETVSDGGPRADGDGGARSTTNETTERVTLRITEDVGQILGVDEREYDLESEDVVTLPTTNAGPLLERDAAERLD